MEQLSFVSLVDVEALWLERSLEETRVLKVVKALTSDKALDLDGYSLDLFFFEYIGMG